MTNDEPDVELIIDDLLSQAYEESMKTGADVSPLIGAIILLRKAQDKGAFDE